MRVIDTNITSKPFTYIRPQSKLTGSMNAKAERLMREREERKRDMNRLIDMFMQMTGDLTTMPKALMEK